MALRSNELMIGDWVYKDNMPVQILALNLFVGKEHEDIEPIPLTPEILVKNGFKKLDFSHYHINNRALVLDADGKWEGPLSWHWVVTEMSTNAKGQPVVLDYYVATINYVHELQHCLKLVGIDKEITI